MHAPTKGTHARTTPAILAKITSSIEFLESLLRETEAERDASSGLERSFCQGRVTGIILALDELREVAK